MSKYAFNHKEGSTLYLVKNSDGNYSWQDTWDKKDILDEGSCTWNDLANSSAEAYGWKCIVLAANHSEIWAVRDHFTLEFVKHQIDL